MRARMFLQVIVWAVGLTAGGFLLVFAGACIWLEISSNTSHLHDWPDFYQSDVSRVFKIPKEAQIVRANDHSGFPMGREVSVKFRLPEQKQPAEWVKHIANTSGIGDEHRVTSLEYDGPGDYNIVRFDAGAKMYEVLYGWD